jgi:hypothetical protein
VIHNGRGRCRLDNDHNPQSRTPQQRRHRLGLFDCAGCGAFYRAAYPRMPERKLTIQIVLRRPSPGQLLPKAHEVSSDRRSSRSGC